MNLSRIVFLLVFVPLTGCASVDARKPAVVADNVRVQEDNYKKTQIFYGPKINDFKARAHLQWVNSYHPTRRYHQEILFIELYDDGWVAHDEAYDSNGVEMLVESVERRLNGCTKHGCSTYEATQVILPDGYLEHHLGGFKVQITGHYGKTVVEIPGAYVQGFLKTVFFKEKVIDIDKL